MAIKLGSSDALFYLGSQVADRAYLGAVQVPRTLYFDDAATDGLWTTLGNWWFDAAHTVPATSLPTTADSVVASASITASGQTVANFTLNDPGADGFALSGTLTVTGMATFNGSSSNVGTLNGNATFNDSSYNGDTVNGNATFNGSSYNGDTVTGTATFNDSSYNASTVTGDATFNGNSSNVGTVGGTATFTGNACNGGTADTFNPDPPPPCP